MAKKRVTAKERDTVRDIIERCDASRLEYFGGYPSAWDIVDGKVVWADYDARKEHNAVELTVTPVKQFIRKHQWVFEASDQYDPNEEVVVF